MSRPIFRVAAGLATALALVLPARAETLGDALIAAYRNSNLLEQNRAVLRAADEDAAQAMATLRPVIAASAGATRREPALGGQDNLTSQVALTAEITLYAGGQNRLALEAARESVLATRESLVDVEQQVLLGAVQAFMEVIRAGEFVALRDNNIRVVSEQLQAARDRFEVGEITRTDVSLAEARLALARANLAVAQGDLQVAREAYRAATGRLPGALQAPSRLPATADTLASAKAVATERHPRIREAQRLVTVSELNIARAQGGLLPTINLSGQVARDSDGEDASSIGISARQTLYAGGRLSSVLRQAEAGRDRARAGLLQTAVLIEQGVGEAWANAMVTSAQIAAGQERVRAAQLAFEGVREEAALGARTTLDVLDAEQELLDARASLIQAQTQRAVASYRLLSAMGLMTADHLRLGVPTYDPAAYYDAVRNAPVTRVSPQGERLDHVLRSLGRDTGQ
ncbi:MAG: TolC family outer membrane protein [Rhodobacteraceae bacterium]|nr:TolC family outer membrane protein [Paracoccaceae bacterium]